MDAPVQKSWYQSVKDSVGSLFSSGKSAATAVLPSSVTPPLNTAASTDALGAQPEAPGYTAAGGRRRKTKKHYKSPRKTRRHRRHHGK
jgi:hypothetical protein